MNELPKGWAVTTLGKVALWGSGGTPSRKNKGYYQGNIPWIKTGDLGERVIHQATEFITSEAVNKSSARFFPKGSVAIAMYGATIGKTSILGIDATTNQACGVGQPIDGITKTDFLYYLLNNEKENFIAKGKGGAQPNISQTIIKSHQIWLPPLNEQICISNKLDSLLGKVEDTQKSLDKIPTLLKCFRQSVLAAAVSGELLEDKAGWKKVILSEVADSRLGKMLDKNKNKGEYYPYLRNINIRWFDIDLTDIYEMKVTTKEIETLSVNQRDVLVCEGGEPGRCAIWKGGNGKYIYQKALHRIRVKPDLLPEWLCYVLKNSADSGRLKEYFTGTTIKHFTGLSLKSFKLELPSIEEQKQIVERAEVLLNLADKVEQQYLSAKQHTDKLTQSILAKAFQGELVPQDSNDEPASELLKRIKLLHDTKKSKLCSNT